MSLPRYVIYFRLNMTMEISSRFDELKSTANTAPTSGGFRGRPRTVQNFLSFMQFFTKLGKIICWCPPLEGWRSFLRGILDPPLSYKQLMNYLLDLLFTPSWADTPWADSPRQTALDRHPLLADISHDRRPQQTPLADNPPPADTSHDRHPPGRHPLADTPWADTPAADTPWQVPYWGRHPQADIPPWVDTPKQTPLASHPSGRHNLGQTSPP